MVLAGVRVPTGAMVPVEAIVPTGPIVPTSKGNGARGSYEADAGKGAHRAMVPMRQ